MLKKNSLFLRLIAGSILLLGILNSIFFGQTLKDNAEKAWYTKATETAEEATNNCLSWFALQQAQLLGIASLFHGSEFVTEDEFYDVLDLIEAPDSIPLHSIAYATNQTTSFREKYIVTLSSDANTIFSPGADLAQNEQILSAISTAHSFPGEVVMSRPFEDSQGNLMSCLLITVPNSDKAGIVIATMNVLALLEDLTTLHIPNGLHLLAIQMTSMADGTPQQTEFFQSAISSISQTQDFHIRVDSGKAHLEYLWEFTPDFSGGPAIELGRLVQVAGSLFSLILFVAMWLIIKENVRVRQKVEERTIELSAAVEKTNNEIIEKVKTEQALKASTERLKALSEASFEAIILSENGLCIDLNNTAVKMFGYSKEEAIGSPSTIIFTPEQLEKVQIKVQTEDKTPYEVIATRKDGSVLPLLVQGRTIDHFGKKVRVTAMSNITERKNAEKEKDNLTEQLHQAKKMESIGMMAGGVAHDLNNILSGIIGYPELLLPTLSKESKLRKPIEAIRDSGQRAAMVVADLLTVARGVATTREAHNIHSLIQEHLDSLESVNLKSMHANIRYQHKFTATQPTILCSSVHVKKCLMNLVINAAESIVEKGTVTVSTHNQYIDESASNKHKLKRGEYVVLSVQDTGPGIASSHLEHIFEPFYTRKEMARSGTGLGLTIVWNTMKDHDGRVSVESSDKGTCFQLFFPVSQEKTVTPNSGAIGDLRGNGEHILIVDDEPHLRDIGSQMLQTFGYKVDSVSSGELALEFTKENKVDLLVLDMLMEPGITGRQTYEAITKRYPGQKAIIASGFSESDDVKATLQLGAGGFIKKPYSTNQLGRAVKEILTY